jgi:hypothetical protein
MWTVLWRRMDGQATGDSIMRHIRFACWVNKATETHSEYIIVIAFPHQQRLRERPSVLRYTDSTLRVLLIGTSISDCNDISPSRQNRSVM